MSVLSHAAVPTTEPYSSSTSRAAPDSQMDRLQLRSPIYQSPQTNSLCRPRLRRIACVTASVNLHCLHARAPACHARSARPLLLAPKTQAEINTVAVRRVKRSLLKCLFLRRRRRR